VRIVAGWASAFVHCSYITTLLCVFFTCTKNYQTANASMSQCVATVIGAGAAYLCSLTLVVSIVTSSMFDAFVHSTPLVLVLEVCHTVSTCIMVCCRMVLRVDMML
jgi:hypothetical protein